MGAAAFALLVIGYAAVYSGASNLFSGGKGWGFLQSLIHKGTNSNMAGMASLITGTGNSGSGIAGTTPVAPAAGSAVPATTPPTTPKTNPSAGIPT